MNMKSAPRRASAILAAGVIAIVASAIGLGPAASAPPHLAGAPRISNAHCAANKAAGKVTFVSPFGFGPTPGLIEIFIAKQLGYFSAECLDVNIVTSSYVPNELVSADTAQFTSEGSAADTLEAIGSGAHMVSVATFADTSTYVLLTSPSITNLKQLAGKTLAYHTTMPVVLTEMLEKAGADYSKIKLLNDTSYDPTLLTRGKFSALQAYEVNEPLILRADHLAFKEWYPASFGVSGTFNTVVANATFVTEHPIATADFLRAEMHAIDYCEAQAMACIKMEAADAAKVGVVYQIPHSIQEWNLSIKLVNQHTLPGTGIGVQTVAEWEPEAKAILQYHILPKLPSLTTSVNTAIVDSIYDGTKLIWPGT